jgi:hypothetical protein
VSAAARRKLGAPVEYGTLSDVSWRKIFAGLILLAAIVAIFVIAPFPRPVIVVPACLAAAILSGPTFARRMRFFAVATLATTLLLIGAQLSFQRPRFSPVPQRTWILRLYDLNCAAPFPTYRYPRDLVWLSKGALYGSWTAIARCGL